MFRFIICPCLVGLLVNVAVAQDAFPRKPSELEKDPSPLVDVLGKNAETAPPPTEPQISDPAEAPKPKFSEPKPEPKFTEPKPKPKFSDPERSTVPNAAVPEFVIASGDSLTKISLKAYGRTGYWRLLKHYNDCDPSKLKIGQIIKAPKLDWLLEQEGIVPLLKDAVDSMMKGRSLFMEAETAMDGKKPDEETKAKIVEAQKAVAHSRALFSSKRDGVSGLPNSTLKQLRSAGILMGDIANGKGNTKGKATLAHEHFGNALTYCVIWAQDGFR